ncbi:MAG TPA: energy transducer TonB [Steroidobacteraceae bacterium]|nr:energy transducer TonB [Steroidobacteraceae bacterium]
MTGAIRKILITGILFGVAMLQVSSVGAQVAQKKMMLPPMNASVDPDVYPFPALKNAVQGRVLLEFTITRRGKIDDVTVVDSEPQGMFDTAAKKTLGAIKFTPPKDWEDTGGALHRFTMSVVFKLTRCPTTPCVVPQPHDTADDFLIITAAPKG